MVFSRGETDRGRGGLRARRRPRACPTILLAGLLSVVATLAAQSDPDGTTPLHWAVRDGDLTEVKAQLGSGADPNAANRYGITPLSLAARDGDAPIAKALLDAGANPLAALPEGQTLLMTAARGGSPEIVRMLLVPGADVNARESTLGETALIWAAAANRAEAARLLINAGADVNLRATKLDYPKDRFGLEGVLTILPHGDWTPLMYAAREGSLETARVLADAGAELNAQDPDGTTALVFAILNGHFDTAALLVEKGADPNVADSAGMAALYAATDMNTLGEIYGRPRKKITSKLSALDLMGILLEHGAEPNAALTNPTLARAHTPGEGSLREGTTPLMRAAHNGDTAGIRLLVAHGADPNLTEKDGTTALMLASGIGRGMGVFAEDYATEGQLLEAVEYLVSLGVDVNAADKNGDTALHFATRASDDIVRFLVKQGASLTAADTRGRTPLEYAMGKGLRPPIAGGPLVRESTVELVKELLAERGAVQQ